VRVFKTISKHRNLYSRLYAYTYPCGTYCVQELEQAQRLRRQEMQCAAMQREQAIGRRPEDTADQQFEQARQVCVYVRVCVRVCV